MAIPDEWTDPDDLEQGLGEARFQDFNKLVANLKLLAYPPAVLVELTAGQDVSNNTWRTIAWDGAAWQEDRWGTLWTSGAPSKIVLPIPGLWRFTGAIHFPTQSGTGTTRRGMRLRVNGNVNRAEIQLAGGRYEGGFSWERRMQAGDEVDLQVEQHSGETLTIDPQRTLMSAAWCGFLPGAALPAAA